MKIYYNENNKFAANWLEKLINKKLIPEGDVDRRSIIDVNSDDLKGYDQCHFFAGIGGWPYALNIAKWPKNKQVWTGSCPCQPFSVAGNKKGFEDERDLWPTWFNLIKKCRPSTCFGEQVATAISYGWLDRTSYDLEEQGYTIGTAVLPACSVNSPHQRKRLFFVANTSSIHEKKLFPELSYKEIWEKQSKRQVGYSCSRSYWNKAGRHISIYDNKTRRVEPSIPLLVNGFPTRLGILHGLGNAIVPQVAAGFIKAFMEVSI